MATVQDFEFSVSSSLVTPVLSSPQKQRTTLLMCNLVLAFLFKFVNHAEVLKKIALIKQFTLENNKLKNSVSCSKITSYAIVLLKFTVVTTNRAC